MDKNEQLRKFMEEAKKAGFTEKKEPFTFSSFAKVDPRLKPKEPSDESTKEKSE